MSELDLPGESGVDAFGAAGGGMDVQMLAAALRQDSADLDVYAKVLSVNLVESLPRDAVQVVRKRSLADRAAGREGNVVELDVALGDVRLALRMDRGRVAGEICKEVRGVVLSRQQVGLDEWIAALAQGLADAASQNAKARDALQRWLT
ncbi:MAG TPA: hypothetical protein VGX23_24820 [Actinocrinis sp.]|nr:hypothetical protein [Actinocrinis sp.]